jgi:hypothetical protein
VKVCRGGSAFLQAELKPEWVGPHIIHLDDAESDTFEAGG